MAAESFIKGPDLRIHKGKINSVYFVNALVNPGTDHFQMVT